MKESRFTLDGLQQQNSELRKLIRNWQTINRDLNTEISLFTNEIKKISLWLKSLIENNGRLIINLPCFFYFGDNQVEKSSRILDISLKGALVSAPLNISGKKPIKFEIMDPKQNNNELSPIFALYNTQISKICQTSNSSFFRILFEPPLKYEDIINMLLSSSILSSNYQYYLS